MEPTPSGRLAAIVRAEIYRQYDQVTEMAGYTYRLPDYADLRAAMDLHVEAELTNARLEESRLAPNNVARSQELFRQLLDIYARQKLIAKFYE